MDICKNRFISVSGSSLVIQLVFIFLLGGCQTSAPTRVTENQNLDLKVLSSRMSAPVVLSDELVVIDTRSRFDYTMAHVPGSIPLSWQEFVDGRSATPGRLQPSFQRFARRLALLGVHSSTPVLVLGNGLKGKGDEGRLAWTLFYLGVTNIQIADIEAFAKGLTNVETPPRKNADYWEPNIKSTVEASQNEVENAVFGKKKLGEKIYLIDVRSKAEYFRKKGRNSEYSAPDLGAINIEWRDFFQPDGRPHLPMRDKLRAIGIQFKDRVIAISDNGVRSAAVTMALPSDGIFRGSELFRWLFRTS
ncbi:MAG: hypothetical protein IPJ71_11185 [Bdellovibrionales bacterium]|nr:hypothetical protein [Bdellovibrionales bacterium]